MPETHPAFDRRSIPAYFLLIGGLATSLILFKVLGFRLASNLRPPYWMLCFPIVGILSRRIGLARVATASETMGIIYGQAIFFYGLFALTALSAPFADSQLAGVDRWLGFDWIAFARFLGPALPLLDKAYSSFALQAFLICSLLAYLRQDDRAWKLATAAPIALLLTAAIYPFFPAEGAMIHHHSFPWEDQGFGPVILSIKDGAREIKPSMLKGLVSFPSYHAAAAVLFGWAAWTTKLRSPFVILNALMALSSIVIGSHYLIDILAGCAVGLSALTAADRLANIAADQRASGSSAKHRPDFLPSSDHSH